MKQTEKSKSDQSASTKCNKTHKRTGLWLLTIVMAESEKRPAGPKD